MGKLSTTAQRILLQHAGPNSRSRKNYRPIPTSTYPLRYDPVVVQLWGRQGSSERAGQTGRSKCFVASLPSPSLMETTSCHCVHSCSWLWPRASTWTTVDSHHVRWMNALKIWDMPRLPFSSLCFTFLWLSSASLGYSVSGSPGLAMCLICFSAAPSIILPLLIHLAKIFRTMIHKPTEQRAIEGGVVAENWTFLAYYVDLNAAFLIFFT